MLINVLEDGLAQYKQFYYFILGSLLMQYINKNKIHTHLS